MYFLLIFYLHESIFVEENQQMTQMTPIITENESGLYSTLSFSLEYIFLHIYRYVVIFMQEL